MTTRMRMKLARDMLLRGTTGPPPGPVTRDLGRWCDYCISRNPPYQAVIRGKPWGQSCLRHAGRLLLDALSRDPYARLETRDAAGIPE